jgi:chromosome partitioning protein
MANVIAVVGSKGGTGKSSISHLLAHGAGSLPRPIVAVVMTTDPEDEMPDQGTRRYGVVDARSPEKLLAEMRRLLEVPQLLIILDGAAARADLDAVVAKVADLALVPFGPSAQEAARAVANLARMPGAWALPNRWPAHPGTRRRAATWLATVPAERRMPPFGSIPRLDGLLSAEGYAAAAYDLASPSRNLLLEALHAGRLDPHDMAATGEAA